MRSETRSHFIRVQFADVLRPAFYIRKIVKVHRKETSAKRIRFRSVPPRSLCRKSFNGVVVLGESARRYVKCSLLRSRNSELCPHVTRVTCSSSIFLRDSSFLPRSLDDDIAMFPSESASTRYPAAVIVFLFCITGKNKNLRNPWLIYLTVRYAGAFVLNIRWTVPYRRDNYSEYKFNR